MKQLPLILGVIIVVLVGAGAGFVYMQRQAASSERETTTPTAGQPATGMMSLKELMALGQSQECTFSYSDTETGSTTGTSYISGNKVRTDFTIIDPEGQQIEGGMIMADSTMYTWTSASGTGVKMEISTSLEQTIEDGVESTEFDNNYIDPDEKLEYNCKAWREDPSKFVPPTTVEFVDLSEQMKMFENLQESFGAGSSGSTAESCAICDALPSDAAAACRSSLNCN